MNEYSLGRVMFDRLVGSMVRVRRAGVRGRRAGWATGLGLLLLLPMATMLNSCGGGSSSSSSGSTSASNAGNFTNTVFIGDSLTAGYQSGSLLDSQQVHGYANLLATQINFPITLPLIAPPGAPSVLELVSISPLPLTQQAPGTTTGRDDPTAQPTDVAVPGHAVNDVVNTVPLVDPTTGEEQITQLVLGFPGLGQGVAYSQATQAAHLHPTTIILWIGNNDALIADLTGMPSSMTPVAEFTSQYAAMMQQLSLTTNAHFIIANVPDVTAVPYLTPAAEILEIASGESGLPTSTLSVILGISPGDYVTPAGVDDTLAILQQQLAGPLTDADVLTAAEAVTVQTQVTAFNQVIMAQAAKYGATMVDIHALFDKYKTSGLTINGYPATFGFLNGLFSLDGIHPTNTGYGLLANTFIDSINTGLGKSIPDYDLNVIAQTDPLFPTNLEAGKQKRPMLSLAARAKMAHQMQAAAKVWMKK